MTKKKKRGRGRPKKRRNTGARTQAFLTWLAEHKNASQADIDAAGFGLFWRGGARKRLMTADAVRARVNHDESGRVYHRFRIGVPYEPKVARRIVPMTKEERERATIKAAVTVLMKRGFRILPPVTMTTKPTETNE